MKEIWKPKRINRIDEIHQEIQDENNLLGIFDIDDIFITTKDIFLHPECDIIFSDLVSKEFSKAKTDEERHKLECLLSLCIVECERVLVENSSPNFVKSLQKRGIKTIALTNWPIG